MLFIYPFKNQCLNLWFLLGNVSKCKMCLCLTEIHPMPLYAMGRCYAAHKPIVPMLRKKSVKRWKGLEQAALPKPNVLPMTINGKIPTYSIGECPFEATSKNDLETFLPAKSSRISCFSVFTWNSWWHNWHLKQSKELQVIHLRCRWSHHAWKKGAELWPSVFPSKVKTGKGFERIWFSVYSSCGSRVNNVLF